MDKSDSVSVKAPRGHFFTGQFQHLLILGFLLAGAFSLFSQYASAGVYLGHTVYFWFKWSILLVILQQVLAWLVFRSQLQWNLIHRLFGKLDFTVWGLIFMPLLVARPLLLVFVGLGDTGTLGMPAWLRYGGAGVLLIPAIYAMYSVGRYFGMKRALGGDHFRESYRTMPLVNKGIYRYTGNAMYSIIFLSFWAIALLLDSPIALIGAAFQHAYIWAHFYCTEEPDMRVLHP